MLNPNPSSVQNSPPSNIPPNNPSAMYSNNNGFGPNPIMTGSSIPIGPNTTVSNNLHSNMQLPPQVNNAANYASQNGESNVPLQTQSHTQSQPPTNANRGIFDNNQLLQLRAQINAYKLLAKSNPVSSAVILAAEGKLNQLQNISNRQHPQNDTQVVLTNTTNNNTTNNNNDVLQRVQRDIKSSCGKSLFKPNRRPEAIDPEELLREHENRIEARIIQRIDELTNKSAFLSNSQNMNLKIELKALRLLSLQRSLRQEILMVMKKDTSLETALNVRAYRRPKKQTLREARFTEKLEKQMKHEQEKRRRQKHQEFLNAVLLHAKEFREFHRNCSSKLNKINRGIMNYFANTERDKRKEQERLERERMRRLMAEDEEGYRKLIDEKKDMRLHYLLQQTDEFIAGLTKLVKDHKKEQINRKKKEREEKRTQMKYDNIMAYLSQRFNRPQSELSYITRDIISGNFESYVALLPQEEHIPIFNPITRERLEEESPQAKDLIQWFKEHEEWRLSLKDEHGLEIFQEDDDSKVYDEVLEDDNDDDVHVGTEDDEYNKSHIQSYYALAHSHHEEIKEQASILINGTLKQYQLKGLEWLVSLYNNNLNGILADEMGLGKTIQTIGLITYLMERKKVNGPFLIIVPLS